MDTTESAYAHPLARSIGALFVAGALGALARNLLAGQETSPGLLAALLISVCAGLATLRWPPRGRVLSTAIPIVGAPVVAFGMLFAQPASALYGVPYLVWLVGIAAFLQRPATAFASTMWIIACFVAWSVGSGRALASDVSGVIVLGMTALAGASLAREVRNSHARLDTARRDAEVLSLRDPLTGLANRRAFDAEAQLRASENRLGGILMLDIDFLKAVNDDFGHDAGDQVLAQVARRLAGAIRGADLAARVGGDEFAVLLEGPLTLEGLRRVADAVRGATSAFAAQTSAGAVRVTTSTGGALVNLDSAPDAQVRSARARADNALYHAKQTGRDRAVLDGETRAPSPRRGRRRRSRAPRAA